MIMILLNKSCDSMKQQIDTKLPHIPPCTIFTLYTCGICPQQCLHHMRSPHVYLNITLNTYHGCLLYSRASLVRFGWLGSDKKEKQISKWDRLVSVTLQNEPWQTQSIHFQSQFSLLHVQGVVSVSRNICMVCNAPRPKSPDINSGNQ